jgi:hypothetical protein
MDLVPLIKSVKINSTSSSFVLVKLYLNKWMYRKVHMNNLVILSSLPFLLF